MAGFLAAARWSGRRISRSWTAQKSGIRRDRVTGGVRIGKRYRDVIRRVALGMRFAVVCVEEQSEVDYTMPFRVIGYDLDRYEQQLRIRRQEHRERKDLKAEEYLSGISRRTGFCQW